MQLLHPFMPFCTEEFYATVKERNESDVLVISQFENLKMSQFENEEILSSGNLLKELVSTIRDLRNKNQLKPKDALKLNIETLDKSAFAAIEKMVMKLGNLSAINFTNGKPTNGINFVLGNNKFSLDAGSLINTASQKDDLQKELAHLEGFLKSVNAKLGNEKFVANAKPEVIALEQKKKSDAESRMNAINESLVVKS
jgi:valyl-tRNA synthetase